MLRSSILTLSLLASCSDAPDGGDDQPPACVSLAGTWTLTGTCGPDTCEVRQADCSLTAVTCTSGSRSTSGSIVDDDFTYSGLSGAGQPATCTGTVTGATFAGQCTGAAGSCTIAGQRR